MSYIDHHDWCECDECKQLRRCLRGEGMFDYCTKDGEYVTMNNEHDPNAFIPEPIVTVDDSPVAQYFAKERSFTSNFGNEQTGKAKVSMPLGFKCPHSELFGPGVEYDDSLLKPISPSSERVGRVLNAEDAVGGDPLPAPAMTYEYSPVEEYFRNRR